MSKYDNIYEKLTDTEKEFKDLLIRELETLSHGGYSSYLDVRSSKYHIGKKSKNSNTIYMEKLEKEIIHLRERIFGDTEYGILQVVEEFAGVYQNWYKFSKEDIQSAAKNILHELQTTEDDNYQSIKEILSQITVRKNNPRDIIVKARKNRFYPMSPREISDLLDKFELTDSMGNRLRIELCNPQTESLESFPLVQMIPDYKIIINSLPDSFNKESAKELFISARKES